jgi:hypothetical protein
MPRISRFVVKFDVESVPYTAQFKHNHAKTYVKGSRTGDLLPIQHETTCQVSSYDRLLGIGTAECSAYDEYDWRKGVKLAYVRALRKVQGMNDVQFGRFMHSFFIESKKRE